MSAAAEGQGLVFFIPGLCHELLPGAGMWLGYCVGWAAQHVWCAVDAGAHAAVPSQVPSQGEQTANAMGCGVHAHVHVHVPLVSERWAVLLRPLSAC